LNAWGYVAGIMALGGHLWWGWGKAVTKMGLEARDIQAADTLGKWCCIAPIVLAFISQPMYVLYVLTG